MIFKDAAKIILDNEEQHMAKTKRAFGDCLREALNNKKMTQTELSSKLNIPLPSVNAWLMGRALPRPKAMDELLKLVGEEYAGNSFYHFTADNYANNLVAWNLMDLLIDKNVVVNGRPLSLEDKKRLSQIAELVFTKEQM